MSSTPNTMPFLEHLAELRTCLMRSLIGIAAASIAAYFWSDRIFYFLQLPLLQSELRRSMSEAGLQLQLIGTGPAEALILKLQVALAAGVIISLPYTFRELWIFISPGLLPSERRMAAPFIFFSTLFFIGGVSFCYFMVLPPAFRFFVEEYQSIGISAAVRINEYLSFILKTLLVFGCVFEAPVVTYFLARGGLVDHIRLLKWMRHAVVVIFIIAAVLTPPDVLSQMLLAVPMLVLYGICIGICYFFGKGRDADPADQKRQGSC